MTLSLTGFKLGLELEPRGGLRGIHNPLTDETYAVVDDGFVLAFDDVVLQAADFPEVETIAGTAHERRFRLVHPWATVDIRYDLKQDDEFVQKYMALTFAQDVGLKHVTVSRLRIHTPALDLVCYRHPDFDWISDYILAKHGWDLRRPADTEPSRTFFGRTPRGGLFTGLETPCDNSRLDQSTLTLAYTPNLKVRANECLACEPMYVGVYRRSDRDARAAEWVPMSAEDIVGTSKLGGFDGTAIGLDGSKIEVQAAATSDVAKTNAPNALPLPSESAAMQVTTSAVLGPPRHGLLAFACAWHCQMEHRDYDTEEKLEGDLRSLEFLASCGLDGVSDSHPWGGETAKMNGLREGDRYTLDTRVRRFLERARELGLKVTQWPTMNNTHPWSSECGPFRLDRPDWLRGLEAEADVETVQRANCLACAPFYQWLEQIIIDDALGTGLYEGWGMDGDFWGTGDDFWGPTLPFYISTLPVTCPAENHDHLPGDSNYACWRRFEQLVFEVRRRHPDIYIMMCRPPMDFGVWAQRNIDACFTLMESGTGESNIDAGNEIRTAARIRVHHHFFPHWLDWGLLFPSFADENNQPAWPSTKIDYIMLSALSCSPNLLMYLPTKTGIPEEDKTEIRKWLDWGRANEDYLFVRHDLFDWPAPGRVDGSAHLCGDHGLVFLFNPDPVEHTAEFALTPECTGFTGQSSVVVSQEYPAGESPKTRRPGATVRWDVPPQSAIVLRVCAGDD